MLEAKDGVDALSVAKNHASTIHLVVTDVVMPNMSGGQLAKDLAQVRPDAKLLFVSGMPAKLSWTTKWSIRKRISCRNPIR